MNTNAGGATSTSTNSGDSLPSATGDFQAPSMRRLVATVYEYALLSIVILNVFRQVPLAIDPDTKIQPLSLLGMVIPTEVLITPRSYLILKSLTFIAIALWCLKIRTRWIYVAAPILFIGFMSTVAESYYFTCHQTQFCAMAFVLLGAAKFSGVRNPKETQTLSTDRVLDAAKPSAYLDPLPGWCFMLLVYYIGISYTYSGLSKLYFSGFSWADGSSLMMWVEAWATGRENPLYELLTNHHWLARMLQTTTLVAELFAILMLFIPRLRPVLGLIFVGFHLSIELLFDFGFFANIFLDTYILIVCFVIPEYRIGGLQFFRELLSGGQTSLFPGPEPKISTNLPGTV